MLAFEANKEWAYKMIERWDNGEMPEQWSHAYRQACKVVGQEPKPHPDKVRKTKYCADIDG